MSRIFISYRRGDADSYAGRLYEALARHYGDDRVFKTNTMKGLDLLNIRPALDNAVNTQDEMLVLIGPGWLNAVDRNGNRRLEDPDDPVRIEILSALASRDIRVTRVLVGNAPMLWTDALPEDLKPLGLCHVTELKEARWDKDVERLIRMSKPTVRTPYFSVLNYLYGQVAPETPSLAFPSLSLDKLKSWSVPQTRELGEATGLPGILNSNPPSEPPEPQSAPDLVKPKTRQLRVFLGHASGDKEAVRELYLRLKADGVNPWLDEEDLLPGQDWAKEIPKAVRAVDIVLVCLSRASITKAGYLQKEIVIALDVAERQPEGTIFVIPLRLEECDVPERLRHLHRVDYFHASGYERLLRAFAARARTMEPTQ